MTWYKSHRDMEMRAICVLEVWRYGGSHADRGSAAWLALVMRVAEWRLVKDGCVGLAAWPVVVARFNLECAVVVE